jgi:L-iditol 2-dehydrogenase
MLAAVYHGINDLRIEKVEKPTICEDEALLRVKAAAICGTDLRILAAGHFKIPQGMMCILGHELAGEVVEVGSQVSGLVPGTRIAIAPNVGCGKCEQCIQGLDHLCPSYEAFGISLDGAFAEYMRIPAASSNEETSSSSPKVSPMRRLLSTSPSPAVTTAPEPAALSPATWC